MAFKLGDIPLIANSIKYAPPPSVQALNAVLGNANFDHTSRKEILNFQTFPGDLNFVTHKADVLKKLSLSDFVSVSNILHLETTGTKEVLYDNILKALTDLTAFRNNLDASFFSETPDADDSKSTPALDQTTRDTSASVTDENHAGAQLQNINSHSGSNECFFLLRELSGCCRNFTGVDSYSIQTFFSDIEENFNLFPSLTDQQKYIFAKKLISGSAKSFLFSQRNLISYDAFKTALINEFSDKVTSLDIHRQLQRRTMRSNESLTQYFIAMREIANRCEHVIDEPSVIQYTIQGIHGALSDKIVLYGAKNFSEFKEKLHIYETVIKNSNANQSRYSKDGQRRTNRIPVENNDSKLSFPNQTKPKQICFNCNDVGHVSKFCPNRSKGPRCLKCSLFGHKSTECPRTPRNDSFTPHENVNNVNLLSSPTNMCKDVFIFNRKISGLVDTGSFLTLLRRSTWIELGSPKLENDTKTLTGFGFSKIQVIGSFSSEITIDDQIFSVSISVVPNNCTNFDLILGCDIINQANLTIQPNGVQFSKIVKNAEPDAPENFIMTISPDPPTFDIDPGISKHISDGVNQLLLAYKPNKTRTANIELNIQLFDDKPIFHSPRRLPFAERDIVNTQVDEWLKDGIIEPCSSPYASQVVVVRKKDGKHRVCIDYRSLNRKLIKDHYPLPLIEDIIDRLQNAKIFSTLDLRNGFFHVPVKDTSRPYTSFVTSTGQFQFRYMPFGLSSCPSVFMRYINAVFRDLIAKDIVLPYMDDLVIPANNESQALERLKQVLTVASEYGLDINFRKCQFLHSRIEFLGHLVEDGKLFPSPSKTKAVLNYPDLKNAKDVQRFLGLTGYFRKFIPSYSTIAKPLSDLLRKDSPFKFEVEQKTAFLHLKQLLSEKPVLSIFNQKSPIEIHTDASIDGLGAVLLQKSKQDNNFHPVYYMSKKTSDHERKYTSYELEVLAIVEALKKFRIYVLGAPFKIVTDCNAFVKTLNKKELNSRIARWALYLQDFDYQIEHRTGTKMAHVDALSRNPCYIIQDSVTLQIRNAQMTDEHITTIKTLLLKAPYDNYIVKNDLLFKNIDGRDLLVVPADMEANIIKSAHERGHFAVKRTQEILQQNFFIPKLKSKIEHCLQNCVTCILTNRKRGKLDGPLHPIEKDDSPLHTYHLDHLGPLPSTSKKYKHVLAVIDSFTKFVWLYPTKSTDSAEVINRLENQSYVFGNPSRIITDRGTAFTSTAFKEYCEKQQICHIKITVGLPRSNGQVERLNSTIVAVLSKLSIENPEKWYSHVPAVQQTINATYQRSINSSPFEILFGTKMKSQQDTKLLDIINEEIQSAFLQQRDELRKDAKRQISKIQDENRRTYNLRRKPAQTFRLNDLVAVKRTQFGPGLKLKQKYLGPYKVTKVKSNNSYDVEKCDFFDGPSKTSTCCEYMKPWSNTIDQIT